jgi:hypothetical protein
VKKTIMKKTDKKFTKAMNRPSCAENRDKNILNPNREKLDAQFRKTDKERYSSELSADKPPESIDISYLQEISKFGKLSPIDCEDQKMLIDWLKIEQELIVAFQNALSFGRIPDEKRSGTQRRLQEALKRYNQLKMTKEALHYQ